MLSIGLIFVRFMVLKECSETITEVYVYRYGYEQPWSTIGFSPS